MEEEHLIACKIQCKNVINQFLAGFAESASKNTKEVVDKAIAIHDLFMIKFKNMPTSRISQEFIVLSNNNVLLSATCYLIACKFHDSFSPTLDQMESILSRRSCTSDSIRLAEFTVLDAIDWELLF